MSDATDGLAAAPGVVILEDLGVPETESKGGLVLPGNSDTTKNFKDLHIGRVVAAGRWISKRSGVPNVVADDLGPDWLKPGDIIQWIPHNPYDVVGVDGRKIVMIFSDDVVVIPPREG